MRSLLRMAVMLLTVLSFAIASKAQVTQTFTSSGTFTVPAGVTSVSIKVYGGAGGTGGQDCGAGCTNAAAGPVGYVLATYNVTAGNTIAVYPGGQGANGSNAVTNTGGGAGGSASYSSAYNGGRGGNTGPSGTSGGGGGGGAATVVTLNGSIIVVAGGAGGGGGMANSSGSGKNGSSGTSANGANTVGGAGQSSSGDGGGGGGGGGGQYGSVGGTVYSVGGETAGNGGYRGNNSVTGAASISSNTFTSWTSAGRIEITYTPVGGTASSNQTICSGNSPANITLSGYAGTIQWQSSTNNSTFTNISGATSATLTSATMGTLTAARYYRAYVSGSVYSNTVTITVNPAAPTAVAPAGSGTTGSPYQVASFENLKWISEDPTRWNKVYYQTANINASPSSLACYNGGEGWTPIGNSSTKFTGTYYGQGYTINNLFINRPSSDYQGLFGYSAGTITFVQIVGATITGRNQVGGLAGQNEGSINKNSCNATVNASQNGGTLVGYNRSTVSNSYSTGSSNTSSMYGGGLAGYNDGTIINCYSSANASGGDGIGGLIGNSGGTVLKSYSRGTVTGTGTIGGLTGLTFGTVTNSFWDTQTSGRLTSAAGTGKTSAEMKNLGNYFSAGWDLQCERQNGYGDDWGMNTVDKNGYPFLSWEGYTSQCPQWNGTNSNGFGTASNWTNGYVPEQGMDIVISPSASNNLVLPSNWTVGNITFNGANRQIELNNYNINVLGTITGAQAQNYIKTNGTGIMSGMVYNGVSLTFPVGNSTYNPVTITNNTGNYDLFSIKVMDEVYLNGSDGTTATANRVRKSWSITKNNPNAGSGVNMTFNYNAGDVSAPISSPALYMYSNNWHKIEGSTSTTSTSYAITGYTGEMTTFSILESSFTLPVRSLTGSVTEKDGTVWINWSTASEYNTQQFMIQHSQDGINFTNIGIQTAKGNTSTTTKYSMVHANPVKGNNYYRIVAKDKDGQLTIGSVMLINIDKIQYSYYPNPVIDHLTINGHIKGLEYIITSQSGSQVMKGKFAENTALLSLKKFAAGIYTLSIYTSSGVKTHRIVKQ